MTLLRRNKFRAIVLGLDEVYALKQPSYSPRMKAFTMTDNDVHESVGNPLTGFSMIWCL